MPEQEMDVADPTMTNLFASLWINMENECTGREVGYFFCIECGQEMGSIMDFTFYLPKAERERMSHPHKGEGPPF